MAMTPDTAFAAAQIIAVLLVATMLDPWAKQATASAHWRRRVAAVTAYCAKIAVVVVLLFDVQIILFDTTWSGTRGTALAIANYFAVVVCGLSIVIAVLNHISGFGAHSEAADEHNELT